MTSWAILDESWKLLGASWWRLGPWWEGLGPPFGPILAPSWPILAPSWPILGPSWPILARLGPSWSVWKASWRGKARKNENSRKQAEGNVSFFAEGLSEMHTFTPKSSKSRFSEWRAEGFYPLLGGDSPGALARQGVGDSEGAVDFLRRLKSLKNLRKTKVFASWRVQCPSWGHLGLS